MTNRRKSRKRLRNRLKNGKNTRKRKAVRNKLKKDLSHIIDMFKNIDIDLIEDILKSIYITTQRKAIHPNQSACSSSNPEHRSSSDQLNLVEHQ